MSRSIACRFTPGRGSRLGPPRQVPSDRGLADLNAGLEQFAVSAGRAPKQVGPAHPADRITGLAVYTGPSQVARSPPPVESKVIAMPLDDDYRFDQHHSVEDLRPDPLKPRPKQPVGGEEPRPAMALPAQDGQLMSQGDEFDPQGEAATNPEREQRTGGGEAREPADHGMTAAQETLSLLGGFAF